MVRRRTCAVSNHEAPIANATTHPSRRPLHGPPQDEDHSKSYQDCIMEIGFIGLGKMGFPMARRLIEAGHKLTVFDTQKAAMDRLVALGARAGTSPKDIADE